MEPTIKLNEALAKSQGEFPPIQKGRTARVATKGGTSFSYDYADLEDVFAAVRPVLSRNGLAIQHRQKVVQPLGVETVCILRHVSGEVDVGEPLVIPCSGDMQPTQAIGSAMTYGRRYTTQSMLGISTETDDDGNAASGNDAETKPKAEKPACPKCGKGESVIPGKEEFGGGWLFCKKSKTPGCGHEWETPERKFCGSKALNTNDAPPDDRRPVRCHLHIHLHPGGTLRGGRAKRLHRVLPHRRPRPRPCVEAAPPVADHRRRVGIQDAGHTGEERQLHAATCRHRRRSSSRVLLAVHARCVGIGIGVAILLRGGVVAVAVLCNQRQHRG
jgi:hypothetical protein